MTDPNKTLAEQLEPMANDLAWKEREAELLGVIEHSKDLIRAALAERSLEQTDRAIAQFNLRATKSAITTASTCWAFKFLPRQIKARLRALAYDTL